MSTYVVRAARSRWSSDLTLIKAQRDLATAEPPHSLSAFAVAEWRALTGVQGRALTYLAATVVLEFAPLHARAGICAVAARWIVVGMVRIVILIEFAVCIVGVQSRVLQVPEMRGDVVGKIANLKRDDFATVLHRA